MIAIIGDGDWRRCMIGTHFQLTQHEYTLITSANHQRIESIHATS
jgi:hypothetical protein